ncbi:DUF4352 domain-containing protein [Aureibacillus halotolerans]|uniref:Uncharacterized protein DUF4352 n=1 Tax=Aureibacillus halotolerans TaxID=1508390 RepID=A0A4R6U6S5_9BACI|nr:DUF4352 domain-containing protein [Aureibacillus halotolerans]TDQ42210.1 uncharacterized protein DUF4352 [Aureibacillus halotolerans]
MTIAKQINWKTIMAGTALSAMLVLSACSGGGEDAPEEEPVTTEPGTTEDATTEEEPDEATSDDEKTNEDTIDSSSDENTDELSKGEGEQELELGETGEIVSFLGTYEVTIENPIFKQDVGGEDLSSEGGTWVIVDATFKNTSDKPLNSYDIIDGSIYNEESDVRMENVYYQEEYLVPEEELAPGEEIATKMIFATTKSSGYQVIIGNDTYSNVLMWNIESQNMAE